MLYRHEKSSSMKNASASPQRSLRGRSGNRHVQELEEPSDVPSDSASPKRRQSQSTHELVGHSGQTKKVSLTASAPQINQSGSQCVRV
jgi:phosphohistidine phosphatase SixA